MTNQITPPPELVARWKDYWFNAKIKHINLEDYILAQAAQWGADQELDACCKWLGPLGIKGGDNLRRARRPKPPSLKDQALKALKVLPTPEGQVTLDITDLNTIRRALEALPE
jgi:hypothetical protein